GESVRGAKENLPNAPLSLPRANIERLVNQLALLAEGEGAVEEIQPGDRIGDILVKTHQISENQLEQALSQQKPVGQVLVDMGAIDEGSVENALREQEDRRKKASATTSLKVDTEKLDSLLELVGELVISQSIVIQDEALADERNRGLHKSLSNLGKITKNIQDHVMSLRMVPLRQTFQKMSRLVRDLSKKMGKPVHFNMIGEDTEIDKTLIEELNDPLVHLMRNALDHGIEPPEERVAAGKSSEGQVTLAAYHKGGNVYIELVDDGKGIDRNKILAKGVERGMVTPGQEMTDAEVFALIFEAGFSTAAKVTDVSGRGVGMDVVRSNIDRLGGRVEIASELGKGSTFTVKLPLTMAIVDGMIVRIGGERFIIPTISIRESIRPGKEEISTVKREGEMINIRGRLLPLIRLHQILQVQNAQFTNPWEGLVIIVESDDKEYGLMVDDLLGQQQVVIKSLGPRFRGLPGISGGTILGDGRVGLILDVSGVVTMN
ncbi:MAG: chemotaxis protein CheA, partial [Nitrospinae bacterium]|nr:chemotaxis protein CheA [Nitrospinota bacterium]